MGNRAFFFLIVLLTVLVLSSGVFAADITFAGTWKMNTANSVTVATSNITKIESVDSGIRLVGDSVDLEGNENHLEFTAQFDSKDYPFTQMLNGRTVTDNDDKVSAKKIDDYTSEVTRKRQGNVLAVVTMVVSKDGKTMTNTVTSAGARSATTFDRQ